MRILWRFVVYGILLLVIFVPWILWETDRNQVRRWIYPITGNLSAWSTQCDATAPQWLRATIRDLAKKYGSPASQLVFADASGQISACVNGWEGTPLLSSKITHDTPLRLASLSKMVSFIGLMQHTDTTAHQQWLSTPLVEVLGIGHTLQDPRIRDIQIRHLLNHSAGFDRLKTTDPMTVRDEKPWCPQHLEKISLIRLDFAPGSRFAYGNLGYCLAAAAYEAQFRHSLWEVLERHLKMPSYGLDYLERKDTSVHYNFMHQEFYGPDYTRHFDWQALRAPMGLVGNARGLARFLLDNMETVEVSRSMRDDRIACEESKVESCFDGFLERRRLKNGKQLWRQNGYLFGMTAAFIIDEKNNFLVWLGTGESRPIQVSRFHIEQAMLNGIRN
ncbi:class A beta-lactamase-related serine hydrolase [Allofranklinella schreckenbergeri]|uniref:Class A beta-lactamase-related serine hydrolase n=1 Tax=Allofranklinella schreckenbergeri TaxID=1076744 RepID=A0A3M6R2B1_9BURK|nr:serine hydrolase domain-containing protein [Allofranklinella schreckenbergeri]RMX09367.1 class A beta-lactamase-related serine hydrolase [Allofranklinella schreckenbergeri]